MIRNLKTIVIGILAIITIVAALIAVFKIQKKKYEKLSAEHIELQAEASALDSTLTVRDNRIGELTQLRQDDQQNFESRERQFQNTIRLLTQQGKQKETLITKLETGLRVDLITLTYRDGLLSKPKLIDSTYQQGYRYGN